MNPFLTAAVISAVIIAFGLSVIRKCMYASALQDLQTGRFQDYEAKMNAGIYRFFFARSRLAEMKLNGALVQNSSRKVAKAAKELEALHLKVESQEAINMKLYNFYLGRMDGKNARIYLEKINAGNNEQMKKEAGRTFRIFIERRDDDLEDLIEEMKAMPHENRGIHEYLISRIYEHAGNHKMAEFYACASQNHLAMLDEKTRANWQNQKQPQRGRLNAVR